MGLDPALPRLFLQPPGPCPSHHLLNQWCSWAPIPMRVAVRPPEGRARDGIGLRCSGVQETASMKRWIVFGVWVALQPNGARGQEDTTKNPKNEGEASRQESLDSLLKKIEALEAEVQR